MIHTIHISDSHSIVASNTKYTTHSPPTHYFLDPHYIFVTHTMYIFVTHTAYSVPTLHIRDPHYIFVTHTTYSVPTLHIRDPHYIFVTHTTYS